MGPGEMVFEVRVSRVIYILESFPCAAEVAGQVLTRKMVEELLVIEEVHFAEVAPGVRKDFSLLFISRIAKFYVRL